MANRPLHRRHPRVEPLEDRRMLSVVTVTTDQDVVDFSDGLTSLREAIFATNLVDGPDEIQFDFGHDGPATIVLTQGELQISDDLTITGPGAELLTIDASGNDPTPEEDNGDGSRVFYVYGGSDDALSDVTISGMSLTGGDARTGGAIGNAENLKINSVWIFGNVALRGGGVANGFLPLRVNAVPVLQVVDSTLSGNLARTGSGGRDPYGGYGGAILSSGIVTISNSTISGNSSRSSALDITGDATIVYSTVTGNSGGGIENSRTHLTTIHHSVIAGNGDPSFRRDVISIGEMAITHSLIGNAGTNGLIEAPVGSPDANGNLIGGPIHGVIDAMLAPLADNGGPTLTHALLPGSPAINRGDLTAVAGVLGVPEFDQRGDGFARVFGGRIDMGAYEVQELGDLNLLVDTLVDESDGDFSLGDLSLREAIELANANPVPDTIHFDPILTATASPLPATIVLTQGELLISDDLTITGPGAELLTIDASGNDPTPEENNGDGSRVFNISDDNFPVSGNTAISGLTLTGGDVSGWGGAIRSVEHLLLLGMVIRENSTSGENASGGGVSVHSSDLTINDSTISDNSTFGLNSPGGGIRNTFGDLYISNSVIVGNSTTGDRSSGGGIYNNRNLTLFQSTVSDNLALADASNGGGISHITIVSRSTANPFLVTSESSSATASGLVFGSVVEIFDSTINNNHAGGNGGGIFAGSVFPFLQAPNVSAEQFGLLAVKSKLSGNTANSHAGGIFILDSSTVSDNTAARGGGIAAGNLTVNRSTISGNAAVEGDGGGINTFELAMSNSTISGNTAFDKGGGIFSGQATIQRSTISANSSGGNGGGLVLDSFVDNSIAYSTIAFNTSDADRSGNGSGGGVFTAAGEVTLEHTLVALNKDYSNIGDDLTGFLGATYTPLFSLIGTNRGSGLAAAAVGSPDVDGNLIGGRFGDRINPLLAPLADNGGPTFTHALLPGSPAIDAGDPELFVGDEGVPLHDQRGAPFTRVANGRIDIGAYETQTLLLPGDYNLDETVDAADYTLWRNTLGQTGTALAADGDGNGVVNQSDYVVWKSNFGQTLPAFVEDSAAIVAPVFVPQVSSEAMALSFARTVAPSAASEVIVDAVHETQAEDKWRFTRQSRSDRQANGYERPRQLVLEEPESDHTIAIDRAIADFQGVELKRMALR